MISCRSEPPRRTFISVAAAAIGALTLFPGRSAWAKKLAITLARLPELKKVGGSVTKKIKGQVVLFVRVDEKTVRAYDPTCTHQKCLVTYSHLDKKLNCKCHKSSFSLTGVVLGGPAPENLRRFAAKLDGERVVFDLPEEK